MAVVALLFAVCLASQQSGKYSQQWWPRLSSDNRTSCSHTAPPFPRDSGLQRNEKWLFLSRRVEMPTLRVFVPGSGLVARAASCSVLCHSFFAQEVAAAGAHPHGSLTDRRCLSSFCTWRNSSTEKEGTHPKWSGSRVCILIYCLLKGTFNLFFKKSTAQLPFLVL